jgi:hypothetical protein
MHTLVIIIIIINSNITKKIISTHTMHQTPCEFVHLPKILAGLGLIDAKVTPCVGSLEGLV